jgi:hypothetical protein
MRRFAILILALELQGRAATITGNVQDITGSPYSPPLRFLPLSTPLANGPATILDVPRSTPVVNGSFSIVLVGGLYNVDFGPPNKPMKILVPPNDAGTYNFNTVANLATNLGTFVFTNTLPTISSVLLSGDGIMATTNGSGIAEQITLNAEVTADDLQSVADSLETEIGLKENSLSFSLPLSRTANAVSLPAASGSQDGYLKSSDWSVFNSKQSALGYTPVNKAGDTGVGALSTSSVTSSIVHVTLNLYVNAAQFTNLVTALGSLNVGQQLTVTNRANLMGQVLAGTNTATASNTRLEVALNNTDNNTPGGANSHVLLVNPNVGGQTSVSSVIGGQVRAKWRTDYVGNISWVATATHNFYVGGDYPSGTDMLDLTPSGPQLHGTTSFDTDGSWPNENTPVDYLHILMWGTDYWIPLYQ